MIPDPCHKCNGDGRYKSAREINVKVPAGVGDGMRIRLSAQGEVGPGGGPAGDLYVEVHEQEHDTFIREGESLHCTIRVPMADAALGATLNLETLIDGSVDLEIPAGTQPGNTVKLTGLGMPRLRTGHRGDIVAHLDVVVPARLDAKQAEALRAFSALRDKDALELVSTKSHNSSGLFSKLRDVFSGR